MDQILIGANNVGFMILYIAAFIGILYFLMIRPQKKQQAKRKEMLNSLKINDRIMTIGGITGYIRQLSDYYAYVEVADGLVIEVSRQHIGSVLNDEADATYENVEEADSEEDTEEEK